MRHWIPRALLIAVIGVSIGGCRSPMADAQMAEQMRQLGDELINLRQDVGDLHGTVDSLHTIVARQDTLLRQVAGMAGVPVPAR